MVPDSTLLTDLVSYWKLDEASGTRYDSVLTSGNDLTDNNTVGSAEGKQGNAASFVAANNETLTKAASAELSFGDVDFTIAAWFNTGTKVDGTIVSVWENGVGVNYALQLDGSGTKVQMRTFDAWPGDIALYDTVVNDSEWHLAIGWYDAAADTVNIQVDNTTVVTTASSGAPPGTTLTFAIGGIVGTDVLCWNGLIDEVGIWSRVLTADERAALYNSGDGVTYPFTGISLP